MLQTTQQVSPSKVIEDAIALARDNDPRTFRNSRHLGLRVETPDFGPIDVALQHTKDGTPVGYIVVGANISILENLPIGRMSLDGNVMHAVVPFRTEHDSDSAPARTATLHEVMSAISHALRS